MKTITPSIALKKLRESEKLLPDPDLLKDHPDIDYTHYQILIWMAKAAMRLAIIEIKRALNDGGKR